MLTAEEAKQKTQNVINSCATKELSGLQEQINRAISEGKFLISGNGSLLPTTKEMLKKLGYNVTTGSQYNEPYYSISWQ